MIIFIVQHVSRRGKSVNLAKFMLVILMRYFLRYLEDVIATKPKVHSYHDVTAALDSRNNTPSVICVSQSVSL